VSIEDAGAAREPAPLLAIAGAGLAVRRPARPRGAACGARTWRLHDSAIPTTAAGSTPPRWGPRFFPTRRL